MQEHHGSAQGPVPIPQSAVEPLSTLAVPPLRRDGKTISFELFLALLLNLAFLLALFWRPQWLLPEQHKEPPAISVQLVPPAQAPPRPQPLPQPEQPKPQEEPKEQPKPEEKKPEEKKPEEKQQEKYVFKGSGDVTKDKAGKVPKVEADKTKAKPQVEAKKPKPEAPKQTEAEVPDWAKKLASGYDLPAERKSSNRKAAGSNTDDSPNLNEGDGGGDIWSNQLKAQISAHTRIPEDLYLLTKRETIVSITIDRAGNLRGMRLLQSSGVRDFDILVMQGVRDAGLFRPFPPGSPPFMSGVWTYGINTNRAKQGEKSPNGAPGR